MKKVIIYSFTLLTLVSVMIACRKSDNPKLPAGLTSVPEMQFTKDATADLTIAAQTPDAFAGKYTLSKYFKDATVLPKSVDIVIIKNGDRTNQKVIQTNVTSFPATFTITGAQIKTLFGASSALGDSYDIGDNITLNDGTVIPAFPSYAAAANYGAIGVLTQGTTGAANTALAPAAPTVNYACLCKFIITDYGAVGTTVPYKVVADGWHDYNVGDLVPVTIIDATHLSFPYATATNTHNVIVAVDPLTNTTSVAKQVIGNYGDGNGDFSVASTSSASNIVSPCIIQFGVSLNFTAAAGNFGTYVIILKKP